MCCWEVQRINGPTIQQTDRRTDRWRINFSKHDKDTFSLIRTPKENSINFVLLHKFESGLMLRLGTRGQRFMKVAKQFMEVG